MLGPKGGMYHSDCSVDIASVQMYGAIPGSSKQMHPYRTYRNYIHIYRNTYTHIEITPHTEIKADSSLKKRMFECQSP